MNDDKSSSDSTEELLQQINGRLQKIEQTLAQQMKSGAAEHGTESRRPSQPIKAHGISPESGSETAVQQIGVSSEATSEISAFASGEILSHEQTINVDLALQEDQFILEADLPGFEQDEIMVEVTDEALHLKAIREGEEEVGEEAGQYTIQERPRSIDRWVPLPSPVVDEDSVSAHFENGVLTVRLKQADPEESRSSRSVSIE